MAGAVALAVGCASCTQPATDPRAPVPAVAPAEPTVIMGNPLLERLDLDAGETELDAVIGRNRALTERMAACVEDAPTAAAACAEQTGWAAEPPLTDAAEAVLYVRYVDAWTCLVENGHDPSRPPPLADFLGGDRSWHPYDGLADDPDAATDCPVDGF